MIKKSLTSLISLALIISCIHNSMCVWPFDGASKTEKAKNYVHEETKEFAFASGGTLHVENGNNNSKEKNTTIINSVSGNTIRGKCNITVKNTSNDTTATVNGKTYNGKNVSVIDGKIIIDGVEQNNFSMEPNSIIIEGHDKEILELLMKIESNDGNLECVSSELNIDGKNAFIKTIHKDKNCRATISYTLKVPSATFIKFLSTREHGNIIVQNVNHPVEKTQTEHGNVYYK